MTILHEISIKRNNQITNCNGTEALLSRIEQLKTLTGEELQHFAEKLQGYIEALFDHKIITIQDAKDWEWNLNSKAKDFTNV